ncbi:hypothetical protein MHM88_14320 [Epibacterium sp. MM17-32]|uniref:hypothetical protein n=1 Tax=Epibacterium sp. MM17-32 TaxID=2917734 RepID=UPI001EF63BD6|nr:hypothetical protein [Epibacterium sp. MM17-32]MCG7628983.1 hypothetical protein [Epibacterium sp. MM17-32]
MADWTNPVLTTNYTDLLNILKDRDFDLATMFNPEHSTATNILEGTIRWNPVTKSWEKRNASDDWDPLADLYGIDVDKLDGQHGAYYLNWNNFTNKPATFTPSAHNHDDRYYTETEADGRYGFRLENNGDNVDLKAADDTTLSTLTVAYATRAGNAQTVAGKSVDQNLRTTDNVVFNQVETSGTLKAKSTLEVGAGSLGNSSILFWDNNSSTFRTLQWSDSVNDWTMEDNNGTMRRVFHEGHVPTWGEIVDKPDTFSPSAHGHMFDGANRLQIRSETATDNDTLTGLAAELVYQNTDGRLVVHDGSTPGGKEVAYTADIPAPTNLANYARKDQPETFSGALTVNAAVTSIGQVQMQKGRILDTAAAGSAKVMLSVEGNGSALQLINYSAGDYELKNAGRGNSIRITDSTAGVQIRTNNETRLIINDSGIDVRGELILNGNTMWHSGNDGAGSGLNADKLDGLQAERFLTRWNRDDIDADTKVWGVYGVGENSTNIPNEVDYGVMLAIRDNNSDVGWQLVIDHKNNIRFRGGNSPNTGGVGEWKSWRKIWHDGNDGSGSGLDADKLDGIQASQFVRNDSSQTMTSTLTINTDGGAIGGSNWNNGWFRIGDASTGWSMDDNEIFNSGTGIIGTLAGNLDLKPAGDLVFNPGGTVKVGGGVVWHGANDGSGSGLDADKLDGHHASSFLRSNTTDTASHRITFSGGIQVDAGSWDENRFRLTGDAPSIYFAQNDGANAFLGINGSSFYLLGDGNSDGNYSSPYPLQIDVNNTGAHLNVYGSKVWDESNDGSGSGLDADKLDGRHASEFLRSNTSDTMSGNLTVTGNHTVDNVIIADQIKCRTGQELVLSAGEAHGKFSGQTGEYVYLNAEQGISVHTPSVSNFGSGWKEQTTTISGSEIRIGGDKVFHNGYHPNADKWTHPRNLKLTGDLSGNVNFDGSSNITLSASVNNDSHTHDGRYYTKGQADGRYLRSNADDSASGKLTIQHTANKPALKALRRVDYGPDTPVVIIAGDGDSSDVLLEVRGDSNGSSVDIGDNANSSDSVFQIKGNGSVYANYIKGNWIASAAQAQAGTNNDQVMTPLTVREAIRALSFSPQSTPAGKTSSQRTRGTSYQNTRDRPILIVVAGVMGNTESDQIQISPNNSNWTGVCTTGRNGNWRQTGVAVVPPGYWYRSYHTSFFFWMEYNV